MNKLVYKDEYAKIVGAIFEVHKRLGVGLLEKVYQEAFAIELKLRNIPFEREKRYKIVYKGYTLTQEFVADFVCYDKIIVELKSVSEMHDIYRAQVLNYLKITGLKVALLQNFNTHRIKPAERIVN